MPGAPILGFADEATGAKSPFIAAGIPGSVGSSAIALWRELQTLRATLHGTLLASAPLVDAQVEGGDSGGWVLGARGWGSCEGTSCT